MGADPGAVIDDLGDAAKTGLAAGTALSIGNEGCSTVCADVCRVVSWLGWLFLWRELLMGCLWSDDISSHALHWHSIDFRPYSLQYLHSRVGSDIESLDLLACTHG